MLLYLVNARNSAELTDRGFPLHSGSTRLHALSLAVSVPRAQVPFQVSHPAACNVYTSLGGEGCNHLTRQWPEVSDFVARFCTTCKKVWHKSYTSGHCCVWHCLHLTVGPCFQVFSTIHGPSTLWHFLWGSTMTVIITMLQASTCGWVLAPGPTQVLPYHGSWMFMFRVKTLSAPYYHWRNPRKKIIESIAI